MTIVIGVSLGLIVKESLLINFVQPISELDNTIPY